MQTNLHSYKFNVKKPRSPILVVDTVYNSSKADGQQEAYVDAQVAVKAVEAEAARLNARTLFAKLPIEINQRIAEHIENDDDLDSFCSACIATSSAVDGDGMYFWRRRFLANFEMSLFVKGNADFKRLYLLRKDVLKKGVGKDGFEIGVDAKERRCLNIMKQMLVEAFSERDAGNALTYQSQNLAFVLNLAKSHNLFQAIFNHKHNQKREQYRYDPDPLRLQQMIQVMLAPCLLSFDLEPYVFGYPITQQVVYSTADVEPIFSGAKVNMEFLLHSLNFWRYHMVRREEVTLEAVYRALPEGEKPQFWSRQLTKGLNQDIGRYWKGAYAYVDREDIVDLRGGNGNYIQDEFCGAEVGSEFQDLELRLDLNGVDGWSELFETHLNSLRPPMMTSTARTRAQRKSAMPDDVHISQPRSFRFGGQGSDDAEEFTADGWLNPLPEQEGVPGWQRMTMMKYYQDPDTDLVDYEALWAYEGAVLPGGQMMVGRWWSPHINEDEDMYSGPFLLWCVDGAFEKQDRQNSVEL